MNCAFNRLASSAVFAAVVAQPSMAMPQARVRDYNRSSQYFTSLCSRNCKRELVAGRSRSPFVLPFLVFGDLNFFKIVAS